MRIPPGTIKILPELSPLKPRILVRRLAVVSVSVTDHHDHYHVLVISIIIFIMIIIIMAVVSFASSGKCHVVRPPT